MSPRSRVSVGLQAVVLALVCVGGAAPMGAQAQGLVTTQKLSGWTVIDSYKASPGTTGAPD